MKHAISHDTLDTHINWEHESVMAREIDWFWSNMEKGFILWHPEQRDIAISDSAATAGGLCPTRTADFS